MTEAEAPVPALGTRVSAAMDRAERIYLRVLRAAILVIATGLILYAAWLGLWSIYKIAQSPASVVEQPAVVAADELTDAEMPLPAASSNVGTAPQVNPAQKTYYADFVKRYYGLFRTKFEPFRQKEDKQLRRDQFDDAFIDSETRLEAAAKGDLDFDADKADLESLLAVMAEASGKPVTQQRLQKYRAAKKVRVGKKVQRSRTEYREGWNRDSTNCENWFYQPYGCAERRAVQIPYTETVYAMEYPDGTQSHTQIFRAFQDRYYKLLQERREANSAKAESERTSIATGILEGKLTLWTTFQILAGFIVLMFFFLLIAIERHQRRLAGSAASEEPASSAEEAPSLE